MERRGLRGVVVVLGAFLLGSLLAHIALPSLNDQEGERPLTVVVVTTRGDPTGLLPSKELTTEYIHPLVPTRPPHGHSRPRDPPPPPPPPPPPLSPPPITRATPPPPPVGGEGGTRVGGGAGASGEVEKVRVQYSGDGRLEGSVGSQLESSAMGLIKDLTAFEPQVPQVSREDYFIHACIVRGRHHNQLIAFFKAWNLAYRLKRTLVLPDFVQAANQKTEESQITRSMLRTIPFQSAYSIEHLQRGPVKVITRKEFVEMHKGKKFLMACIRNEGCEGVVPHSLSQCTSSNKFVSEVTTQKNILVGAVHLFYYGYQHEKPVFTDTCIWKYIRPAPGLLPEIALALDFLPPKFLAVHQRTFGLNCKKILALFYTVYHKLVPAEKRRNDPTPSHEECQFPWDFVSKYRTGNVTEGELERFYVASDNYHPPLTLALLRRGGIRYNEAKAPIGGNLKVLAGMLIDTWVMVLAERFVGSPLSSMSWNICELRQSLQRPKSAPCETFPKPDYPSYCYIYPDIVLE